MDNLQLKEPNINLKSFGEYVRYSRVAIMNESSKYAIEFLAVSNALGGEVGELQNIVKKIMRHSVFNRDHGLHDEFILEAGDVLHYLLSLIQLGGYDIAYIMAANVRKLEDRKQATIEAQERTVLATTATESRT